MQAQAHPPGLKTLSLPLLLLLLQVASLQRPSGLKLHSAAGFQHEFSFHPPAYPDYLALVGKQEAGIKGVGLSSKLAKTLLHK